MHPLSQGIINHVVLVYFLKPHTEKMLFEFAKCCFFFYYSLIAKSQTSHFKGPGALYTWTDSQPVPVRPNSSSRFLSYALLTRIIKQKGCSTTHWSLTNKTDDCWKNEWKTNSISGSLTSSSDLSALKYIVLWLIERYTFLYKYKSVL